MPLQIDNREVNRILALLNDQEVPTLFVSYDELIFDGSTYRLKTANQYGAERLVVEVDGRLWVMRLVNAFACNYRLIAIMDRPTANQRPVVESVAV